MLVSGWVLLRLEQGVKVPEGALYEVVGGHLGETGGRQDSRFSSFLLLMPVKYLLLLVFCCLTDPYPISRKICLNCVRTFIRGCRWPQSGATPMASKLYGLNFFSFQLPLQKNPTLIRTHPCPTSGNSGVMLLAFHFRMIIS